MHRHVVFVTTELAPATPGGAGAVVNELGHRIAAEGGRVTVVFLGDDPGGLAAGDGFTMHVTPWQAGPGATPAARRSRAAAEAVAAVVASSPADLVEFQDFDAPGFWALTHRADLRLVDTPIALRFHGPVDLMTAAMGTIPEALHEVIAMEKECFALADAVLVPSAAIGDLVKERYHIDAGRVVVAEPPASGLPGAPSQQSAGAEVVCFGRLSEVKGSHDFLDAALRILESGRDVTFRFVGEDGWSATAGRPMTEWLAERIPERHAGRIRFEGRVDRNDLAASLGSAWMAALPSRFESYSLAAYEVRSLGLPIVLPDLAAFRDRWDETTGAAVYDGTVTGLADAITRLLDDEGARFRLAGAPLPTTADPLLPYRSAMPLPRHERSQAGLATAALHRVEMAGPTPTAPSPTARVARTVLRRLPRPMARVAVRLVPQRWKDRFRPVADWRREEARRDRRDRVARFRRGISAGAFPDTADPDVTVVIPCFDQGTYLLAALMSVFEQTFDSWEIVVVDDGSTDPETIEILNDLDLPRTRVIRQENAGLPGARNSGIAAARGDYVVPLDADDELAPDFLSEMHQALANRPDAAYAHCWARLFGAVDRTWATRPFNPYQILLSNSVVGCVLLRRTAWEEVGGYDATMTRGNEDWELWIRLMAAGWEQVQLRAPLFRYRKHGDSMSVATESRFEAGRRQIMVRHPDLYDAAALRVKKRQWYPLVSVLVAPGADLDGLDDQGLDDLEIIPIGSAPTGWPGPGELRPPVPDIAAAIAAARGKFITVWAAPRPSNVLARLADRLESEPAAPTADGAGMVLWRRWVLVDPAPGPDVATASTGVDPSGLAPGAFPDPAWTMPTGLAQPLQRQRPEEAGRLPSWIEPGS